jgi:hypothetical protein
MQTLSGGAPSTDAAPMEMVRAHRPSPDLRLSGVIVGAAGVVAQLGGAILDGDARRVLLLGGIALTVLGACLAIVGPALYRPGRSLALRVITPIVLVALVAGGAVAVQRGTSDNGSGSVEVTTSGVSSARNAAATSGGSAASAAATAGHTHDHGVTPSNGNIGVKNADQAAEHQPDQPLDAATRAQLSAELVTARDVAMRYPTVADATRAGMYPAGGFTPGAGAHYMWAPGYAGGIKNGTVDAKFPASFIYDGTSPSSRIVGLMYISMAAAAPEGFAGPNDHWHRHFNTCVRFAKGAIEVPFPADSDVTKPMCDAQHGTFMKTTVWMVHAWVVPGWESPSGVFSHSNPDLLCADGTAETDAVGFCQGT